MNGSDRELRRADRRVGAGKAAVVSAPVKAAIAVVTAAAALAWGLWVQDLPAAFALVVAIAFGVLAFMAVRAVDRLRPLYRRRRPPPQG